MELGEQPQRCESVFAEELHPHLMALAEPFIHGMIKFFAAFLQNQVILPAVAEICEHIQGIEKLIVFQIPGQAQEP